uniref:Uncharacterized protein n=1 Tax=Lactuca sativa TaxID=4236 RepID=A0A9R1UTU7_LACSA|nr:hypothetical protein LSAT_V11C800390830 [Lactuca sativa]
MLMSLCRLALICLENRTIFWPDDLGVAQRTFLSLYMRSFLLYRETPTISILLSTYAKILMHSQPPDPELQNQIWAIFSKYETCIDTEIQQRAVQLFIFNSTLAKILNF